MDVVRGDALELTVDAAGVRGRAIAYTDLTGPVHAGDQVLLNTTAVVKGLGTGGLPFRDG